jgi:hypothetical protein
MFKLQPAPMFDATVQISVPGGPAAPLRLRFRHLGKSAVQAWVASAKDQADAAFLMRVVAGWEGVQDAAGADVPFTEQAFAQLLDAYAASGREIFNAYLRELAEGRAKN